MFFIFFLTNSRRKFNYFNWRNNLNNQAMEAVYGNIIKIETSLKKYFVSNCTI